MSNKWICIKCNKTHASQVICECGGRVFLPCEKAGCDKPGNKDVYALGYIASVCEEHYRQSSQQDKDDAISFRYAEG